jgi:hypothetical protein
LKRGKDMRMEVFIVDKCLEVNDMVLEFRLFLMAKDMKVNGTKIKWKDKGK